MTVGDAHHASTYVMPARASRQCTQDDLCGGGKSARRASEFRPLPPRDLCGGREFRRNSATSPTQHRLNLLHLFIARYRAVIFPWQAAGLHNRTSWLRCNAETPDSPPHTAATFVCCLAERAAYLINVVGKKPPYGDATCGIVIADAKPYRQCLTNAAKVLVKTVRAHDEMPTRTPQHLLTLNKVTTSTTECFFDSPTHPLFSSLSTFPLHTKSCRCAAPLQPSKLCRLALAYSTCWTASSSPALMTRRPMRRQRDV